MKSYGRNTPISMFYPLKSVNGNPNMVVCVGGGGHAIAVSGLTGLVPLQAQKNFLFCRCGLEMCHSPKY
jgi:hypothetical protein